MSERKRNSLLTPIGSLSVFVAGDSVMSRRTGVSSSLRPSDVEELDWITLPNNSGQDHKSSDLNCSCGKQNLPFSKSASKLSLDSRPLESSANH